MTGRKSDKIIVGITGGMGAGKSLAAKIFILLGYPVFNSDQQAKLCYEMPDIKEKIQSILGKDSYRNGTLNREYVGKIIFSQPELRQKVENIIHPCVEKKWDDFIDRTNKKILFIESALLFESGLQRKCTHVILVTAPSTLREERILKRDGLSLTDIRKRMEMQWEDEKKISLSDFVVVNDERHSILEQITEIDRKLNDKS